MNYYKLKIVCKITNIPADTIRNWEKRYAFLKPYINSQGEKLYSEADIDLLKKITSILKSGGRISEIANEILNGDFDSKSADEVKVSNEIKLMIEDYYSCLVKSNLKEIDHIESILDITVVFKNRIEFIYYPLLERARQEAAKGKISKSIEHFVTYHIRHKIESYLSMSQYNFDSLKCSIVCASPSGVIHEGGLLVLASSMKLRGYNIYYLGAGIPAESAMSFVNEVQPAILAFSIHHPNELLDIIRIYQNSKFPVCVGGIGVRLGEHTQNQIGSVHLITQVGNLATEKLESIGLKYYQESRAGVDRA